MINKNTQKSKGFFTVNPENTGQVEMPSVSKLLNRKKLFKTDHYKDIPQLTVQSPPSQIALDNLDTGVQVTLEAPATTSSPTSNFSSTHQIVLDLPTAPSSTLSVETSLMLGIIPNPTLLSPSLAPLEVALAPTELSPILAPPRRASRPSAPVSPLTVWNDQQLKASEDPMEKGIALLCERTGAKALFFKLETSGLLPTFLASSTLGADDTQTATWQGMGINPTLISTIWNDFLKKGFYEVAPISGTGTGSVQKNAFKALRIAFGLTEAQWLIIVRSGPAQACRGILAFVGDQSMTTHLSALFSLLGAATPEQKSQKIVKTAA
jgi:hypothetical protein